MQHKFCCINPITRSWRTLKNEPNNTHTPYAHDHLGPLHTRAKSHDHEIVRAQKKVSKGRPNTPPQSCSAVTDPQV